ncbi:hypothetical protein RUM43_000723 [Polyplax serrata]|uniref:EMI domain-containing protein n=1 Tax=Polyplax serrata TaxID=468196 RepID=A0AAN8XQW5_POLSC
MRMIVRLRPRKKETSDTIVLFRFQLLIIITIANCILGELEADGENVCLVTKTFKERVLADVKVPVTTYDSHWCWNAKQGFRCWEKTVTYENRKVPRVRVRCETFSCEKSCPLGFYGISCQNKCDCLEDNPCDPETGTCFSVKTERATETTHSLSTTSGLRVTDEQPTATEIVETEVPFRSEKVPNVQFPYFEVKTEAHEVSDEINEGKQMPPKEIIYIVETTTTTTQEILEVSTQGATEGTEYFSVLVGDQTTTYTVEDAMTTEAPEKSTDYSSTGVGTTIVEVSTEPETTTVEEIDEGKGYVTQLPSTYSTEQETTFTVYVTENNWNNSENGKFDSTKTESSNFTVESYLPESTTESLGTQPTSTRVPSTSSNPSSTFNDITLMEVNETESDFERREKQSFFTTFRFVPSLSVLTGAAILIVIIGLRWIVLQHRRNVKKLILKERESSRREVFRESLTMVTNFSIIPVYPVETELKEVRPTLQTFKPPS